MRFLQHQLGKSVRGLIQNFKNPRIIVAFLYDIIMATVAYWMALILRFETFNEEILTPKLFVKVYFVNIFFYIVSFILNGLYKGIWRFSSTHDLVRVIRACLAGTISSILFWIFMTRMEGIPRSLFPMQFFLVVVALGGGRFIYRYLKDQKSFMSDPAKRSNVLIVGAGRAGEKLVRDVYSAPYLGLKVIGFVDDDKLKMNRLIHDVKVLGLVDDLPDIGKKIRIDKIFIAVPSANSEQIKRIVTNAEKVCKEIKILPKVDHILSSRVELSLLRNLKIEDLLGREQVTLDERSLQSMITGQTVLVTGAGGSIGSELCFQISKFKPKRLVLVDYCELFLFELENKFREVSPSLPIVAKIADIRNKERMEALFREFAPKLVFHAAAYKHVPLMENNSVEAITTNVEGTLSLANIAGKHRVEKFILISTDKAVNPTNVMGASKRIAEMIMVNANRMYESTQFISVRFGNVLGSNGSVIPIFKKQIEEGKPLTVTHPDVIRYFMSIPEAAQLVVQAGSMGNGGEVFVLDMGDPVKIVDLAREMARLAGLEEGKDFEIKFTGLRPGEKLFEELFRDKEFYTVTHHGKIRVALQVEVDSSFSENLNKLIAEKKDTMKIISNMKALVPEFNHASVDDDDTESTSPLLNKQ